MLNVVCVNYGNYQGRGADYVNRLYVGVARNLFPAVDGRFVCFTDDAAGLNPDIHIEPLPDRLEGWWCKLALFLPGLFKPRDRVLYFDLDTVLVGSIEDLATYDGDFAILRDFYRADGLQSSVMAWPAGFGAHIIQSWNQEGRPELAAGDQAWIERAVKDPVILQDRFPGLFCSYKAHCNPYPPEQASVVVFHGEPRPHNCGRPWVEAMWSEHDNSALKLNMVDTAPLEQIRAQIKHSATLDLPRIKSLPANDRTVAIVGGGPSINDPVTLAELGRLKTSGAEVWALNGSYDWLLGKGVVPDAHVILDARLENVGFLKNSHAETTHYIASQCNWVVFDYLMKRKRRVIRLDMDAMGDCGSTVGTYGFCIAVIEGVRDIHLFGYDSSYREDDAHAYRQDGLNDHDRVVNAHIGDRTFRAAPWMARQAQDFEGLARDAVAAGAVVTVHGDGLLPYMANILATAPPRAAWVRAQEVLKRLPDGPVHGAEIGVFCGEMSAALLQRDDLSLTMVDSWEGDGEGYAEAVGDWHAGLTQADQDRFRFQAENAVYFASKRADVIRKRSTEAATEVPDGTLDFVFIDADHSYEGCRADIAAWVPKLKPGGLLSGHDYNNTDFPEFGVTRAVDEFAAHHGLSVDLGDNFTWFIRL